MKDIAGKAIEAMRQVDPDACFAVRYWDDDVVSVGDRPPEFTLRFETREALRRCFSDGFLGFGESYMDGAIEVERTWHKRRWCFATLRRRFWVRLWEDGRR